MRKNFKKHNGQRLTFTASFVRFGLKNNFKGPPTTTLLFKDVKSSDGSIEEDHIWFSITKGFEAIKSQLSEGTEVEFDARIKKYEKGYVNNWEFIDTRHTDYKLSLPTKIKIK